MNTSIEVSADLRPFLLKDTRDALIDLDDSLKHANDDAKLAQVVAKINRLYGVYTALSEEADAYPADAVRTATEYTIRNATWDMTDKQVAIEAERLIRCVRAYEQEHAVLAEAIKTMEDWRDRLPPSSYWINAFVVCAEELRSCLPGYEEDDDEEDEQ